jgi:hypothetical protein
VIAPVYGGQQLRLDAQALLQLAAAVKVALGRPTAMKTPPVLQDEPRFKHASPPVTQSRPAVAAPTRDGQGRVAGRVGKPAAQGAARRGRRRGGKP